MPKIAMVMGSDSDLDHLAKSIKVLEESKVDFEVRVLSAHRTPEGVRAFIDEARDRGLKVIIAAAGGAAHLAGAMAAGTTLPVVGVPIPSSPLQGLDALLSTVQMPGGIPVATMGIGSSGAVNAALFALAVLALEDDQVAAFLDTYRRDKAEGVQGKDETLRKKYGRSEG